VPVAGGGVRWRWKGAVGTTDKEVTFAGRLSAWE